MPKHRDDIVLNDIVNAAQLIATFVEGFNKNTFNEDWKTRSAVLYQLTVIGEAVKRLSTEFRASHPQIPWSLITGMRDHLIHAYDLIDWDEAWETAVTDIPSLLDKINQFPQYTNPNLPSGQEGSGGNGGQSLLGYASIPGDR
jgi:uncharacterized protein with HEPN domain